MALPGSDAALPAGFVPTKEAYVDWLVRDERQGAPVDPVGHDWGSPWSSASSDRPDLVGRGPGGDGPVDVEYVWHELAQQWQTPDVGEAIMEMTTPQALAEGLPGAGVPPEAALETSRHFDGTMKRCILGLYRSAIHVGAEWQPDVERVTRPALVLWSKDDPYVAPRFAERLAARVHGELVLFKGCGHWWPYERPAEAATALERFWGRLG